MSPTLYLTNEKQLKVRYCNCEFFVEPSFLELTDDDLWFVLVSFYWLRLKLSYNVSCLIQFGVNNLELWVIKYNPGFMKQKY